MYNFNPYGQQARPSYNMLFSHFKQLGKLNSRIMIQTNSFNQYVNVQPNNAQYNPNMYKNINYNLPPNYNLNANVYNQKIPPAQSVNPPQIKQNFNLSSESRSIQTTYDKSNLLSGVKISSKSAPGFPNPSQSDSTNPLKIQLKSSLDPQNSSKALYDQAVQASKSIPQHFQKTNTLPTPYSIGHQVTPKYPMIQTMPGYSVNQPPPPSYPYNPVAAAVTQPNVQFQGIMPKTPPNLSSIFYIDTKGSTANKNKQKDKDTLTIGQVNRWIQDLYMHLNMTTCSKNLRKAVNVYIQHIMEKFRSGSLKASELKMISPEEIMNFKPNKAEPAPEIQQIKTNQEPDVVIEDKNVVQPLLNRAKKKMNKTSNIYEILQSQIIDELSVPLDEKEIHRREQRSQRFKSKNAIPVYNFNLVKSKTIVGLSQELEKPYLRLTSEPNPLIVRPEPVLTKSFKYVFDKFLKNKNYVYIQEQFRSIRQDIQVQHLRTPFVIKVYTTNARLALLHNDLDQFNQCQTQLKHLLLSFNDCQLIQFEFELYYILYLSLQNMNMDLLRYFKENYVDDAGKANSKVENQFKTTFYFKFANLVRLSISDENFIQYFKLANTKNIDYDYYLDRIYKEAFEPNKGNRLNSEPKNFYDTDSLFYCKLLFKMFESKFRMFSLYTLCRQLYIHYALFNLFYRSSLTLSLGVLVDLLNFSHEDECLNFLK
uniref:SAC3/GNAP family-related protein, putative n=1 Tax=Theileria annulata TaxID=5874 RepID=A0A3B0NF52_THEAN